MSVSRRGFIKLVGASTACLGLAKLGIDLGPAQAYAAGLKIEDSKEVISICPFCSCGCNTLFNVKGNKIINVEGDPDYPVSEGALCAKGAALLTMHVGKHRLEKPLYRAPGSAKWIEKDWNWMLERIARKVKETRDRDFMAKDDKGRQVNRLESLFQLGTSQMDNEECALSHQMLRGLGVVHMDHQARI
jgi:formate dehydrogenase major subunit